MIRLWNAVTGEVLREFLPNYGGAACVAFASDGRLVAGLADGRLQLWDPDTGASRGDLPGHVGGVGSVAIGMGGQVLVSGGRDATVRLWDLARLKELKKFTGHGVPITAVAFNTRGDRLATGGEDTIVRLWDTVSGDEMGRFRGHGGAVTAVAFSPDGRFLASGAWDRSARLWDMSTGQSRELAGLGGGVRAVTFTHDGKELFIGGGKTIKTWEVATARLRRAIATLTAAVLAAELNSDGTILAVGGADGLIRMFDPATGTEIGHLEGHRGPVVAIAYGLSGKLLASASIGASMAMRPTLPNRPVPETPPSLPPPRAADPDQLWADLAGDPRAALAAQRSLATDPDGAVTLLRERLRPAEKAAPPPSQDVLRGLRAVDLLARIGSPAARAVLESLAGGAPESAVTDAAVAALARLN